MSKTQLYQECSEVNGNIRTRDINQSPSCTEGGKKKNTQEKTKQDHQSYRDTTLLNPDVHTRRARPRTIPKQIRFNQSGPKILPKILSSMPRLVNLIQSSWMAEWKRAIFSVRCCNRWKNSITPKNSDLSASVTDHVFI